MTGQYLLLALFWLAWCALHSALITPAASGFLRRLPESINRFSRLVYNIVAAATLFPLVIYTRSLCRSPVFTWQGGWSMVRWVLLVAACVLFVGGARRYDLGVFLGLRQIKSGTAHVLLSEDDTFSREGVFNITRHPWYLGSLMLLWSALPVYHEATVIGAVVLTLYLFVGTMLEERKLVAECGERYRAYQQQVSMLLPWKWLLGFFSRRQR